MSFPAPNRRRLKKTLTGGVFALLLLGGAFTLPSVAKASGIQDYVDCVSSNSLWRSALYSVLPGGGLLSGCAIETGGAEIVGKVADATFGYLLKGIAYFILQFSNLLLYIVGLLFNYVVINTIFHFATNFGNSAAILSAWGVLRDVSNIALIFGFVMMGVATILDIHGYEIKKTLPRLVIFAVLLNFSLLASEAVIDLSNVFASTLSQQISASNCDNITQDATAQGDCLNFGISGIVLKTSGLATIFSTGNNADEGASNTSSAMAYLGLSLFVIVLTVTLLAGAIMLLTRAVVLVFLMILSPIGFAGLAIPMVETYAKDWWGRLLSQSFFAPVYLLMLFIGLKILSATGQPDLAAIFTNRSVGLIGGVFTFTLVIGFMVGGLMVSKRMGAVGAGFATNVATKTIGYPFAVIGRNTVGRGGAVAGKAFNAWVGSKRSGALGSMLKATGAAEEISGLAKKVSSSKIGGFASFDERAKEEKEYGHEAGVAAEVSDLKEALVKNAEEAGKLAQKMGMHGLEEAIKSMSHEQLEKFAEILSPEKFQKLMDSKEVDEHAKDIMAEARFKDFSKNNVKDKTTKDLVQLAKADDKKFAALLNDSDQTGKSYLKEEQLEALLKNEDLTAAQRQTVKDNTAAGRVERWAGDNAKENPNDALTRDDRAKKVLGDMTSANKMKVKTEVLIGKDSDPNDMGLAKELSPADVNAAVVKDKFNDKQIEKLLRVLESTAGEEREIWENFFAKNNLAASYVGWKTPAPKTSDADANAREALKARNQNNNQPVV